MYDAVNNNEGILNLLGEPEHVRIERETLSKTLKIL